jgi:predicted glutamine amidotransferase
MCGLVGMMGGLLHGDQALLKNMLFMDHIRGKHATGVAVSGGAGFETEMFKMALPSPYFLELAPLASLLSNFQFNVVAMGHNRHATKGASGDPSGAHPFVKGHITLMHNGSLTTHATLTKENFTVDSEAIARAFEVDGALATIPKLRGAFALTWIDQDEGTVNFVRNDERPLSFAAVDNRMYWASEKLMLQWLLERPDSVFSSTPTRTVDKYIPMPTGEIWSFPMTDKGINFQEMTKTPVELATPFTQGRAVYNRATTTHTPNTLTPVINSHTSPVLDPLYKKHERDCKVIKVTDRITPHSLGEFREKSYAYLATTDVAERFAKQHHILKNYIKRVDAGDCYSKLDDRIPFWVESFIPHSVGTEQGKIMGRMVEFPHSQIVIGNISRKLYNASVNSLGKVMSAYIASIARPTHLNGAGNRFLTNSELRQFQVYVKVDSIRQADLSVCQGITVPRGCEFEREVVALTAPKLPVVIEKDVTPKAKKVTPEKKPKGEVKSPTNPDILKTPAPTKAQFKGAFGEWITEQQWTKDIAATECILCGNNDINPASHLLVKWDTEGNYTCPICDFYAMNSQYQ